MTDTITLAQLSDVHLAPLRGLALRHLNVKRGLGYLNWHRSRRQVHRGGEPRSGRRRHAKRSGLTTSPSRATSSISGCRPSTRRRAPGSRAWARRRHVTVIPGNHDIYTHLCTTTGVARWADFMRRDAWGATLCARERRRLSLRAPLGPAGAHLLEFGGGDAAVRRRGPARGAADCGARRLLERTPREGLDSRRADPSSAAARPGAAAPGPARCGRARARAWRSTAPSWCCTGTTIATATWISPGRRGSIPVIGVASGSVGACTRTSRWGATICCTSARRRRRQHRCMTRGLDASGRVVEQVDRRRLEAPHRRARTLLARRSATAVNLRESS